jgi:hypothetical protein
VAGQSHKMWIYSQGLGTLYRRAFSESNPTVEGQGYSGYSTGVNNPSAQCLEGFGPIPRGEYVINAPKTGPTDYSLPLVPSLANDMCNPPRSSFMIHGDRNQEPPRAPDTASRGCIILNLVVRQKIWESGDNRLLVVAYSP